MASSPKNYAVAEYPYVAATPDDSLRARAFIGSITVPETHRDGAGRLELTYVRIPARASKPGVPWVYLAGGPGTSAVDSLHKNLLTFLAMAETSDVIAIDQRGAGQSRPSLSNEERLERPSAGPYERKTFLDSYRRAASRAASRWRAAGVRLEAFNTEESADDIAALRASLGADRISIFGASYGSHLGLSIMRRHPEMLERVALALVEGPDDTVKLPSRVDAALRLIAERASHAPELAGRCPNLIGLMRSVFSRLDSDPVTVPITDTETADQTELCVGGFEARLLVAHALGKAAMAASLPANFLRMESGDYSPLQLLLESGRSRWLASAMTHAMDASSGSSPSRRDQIRREAPDTLLGDLVDFPIVEVGDAWAVPSLPDSFRSPVVSSLPVLLISGELDVRTPPANAETALEHLDNGSHITVEGIGHDNFVTIPALAGIVRRFLADGAVEPHRVSVPFRFNGLDAAAAAAAHVG